MKASAISVDNYVLKAFLFSFLLKSREHQFSVIMQRNKNAPGCDCWLLSALFMPAFYAASRLLLSLMMPIFVSQHFKSIVLRKKEKKRLWSKLRNLRKPLLSRGHKQIGKPFSISKMCFTNENMRSAFPLPSPFLDKMKKSN